MEKISKAALQRALISIGLDCGSSREGSLESLRELNDELGLLLEGLGNEILVPDPTGRTKFTIRLQPSKAFKSGILLVGNGEALLFGDDMSGGVLFVSGTRDGLVGLAYEPPENILQLNPREDAEGIIYWNLRIVEWLERYKEMGREHFSTIP